MLLIFLFFNIFHLLSSIRSDYDTSGNGLIYVANNWLGSTCSGSLDSANPVFCPDGTWAYGFQLSAYDSYGILNIYLDCRNQTYDVSSSQIVQYTNSGPTYSSWTLTNSTMVSCAGDSGRDFIVGYLLQMWCIDANTHDTKGIVNVKMQCATGSTIATNFVAVDVTAHWTGISLCKPGYVACGYEFYYKNTVNTYYNFGATNLNWKCCRICEIAQGFFYNPTTTVCDHCDINCFSCYGISTNCTVCPTGYTLTATNSCITTLSPTQITQEFISTWALTGWTAGSASPTQTTCSPFSFMGGYNVFHQNSWFQKSLTGLPTHNTLRLRVKFYRIGAWGTACGFIYIDGSLQLTLSWTVTSVPIYYGQNCGPSLLQNVNQVDLFISHTASTSTIKFQTNLAVSTGFWAISHFMVLTYNNCDLTCLTCSGLAPNQCTSCAAGRFLTVGFTCELGCVSPYYGDSITNTCSTTCTSPNYGDPTNRLCESSCPDNYYKNNNDQICYSTCPSGVYGNPLTGYCVATCPSGMYGNSNNLCSYCFFNCLTCSSTSTNCGSCTYAWLGATPTCSNPSYISTIENTIFNHNTLMLSDYTSSGWTISDPYAASFIYTCGTYRMVGGYLVAGTSASLIKSYSSLSPHTYIRITFFMMKIGNWNNKKVKVIADSTTIKTIAFQTTDDTTSYKLCASSSYTEALRRVDVFFAHTANTLSISITSDLTTDASVSSWGVFELSITLFLCDSTCKTCSVANDPTKCMSCTIGSALYLQSYAGPASCLSTCPSNTYQYTTNNTCLLCDATCLTCYAGTASDCKSCLSNTYLLLPPGPSICSTTCNAKYYKYDTTWQCLSCYTDCATCSTSGSSSCLSCDSTNYLQNSVGPASCLGTCPTGKYMTTNPNICMDCDTSCLTCTQAGINGCTSCKINVNIFLYSVPGPSTCGSSCDNGYYPDSLAWQCLGCNSNCATCSISGASGCLTCNANTYLQATGPSSCLSTCPTGKYPDAGTLKCLSCDNSCKACTAGDANSCTSCNSPNYLQSTLSPSQCLTTCPNGYYPDDPSRDCLACDTTCLTCSGSGTTNCLTCKTNSYIQFLPAPSSCISTCPNGKYPDSVSLECLLCDNSCKTCTAGDANSCTGCNSPNYLQSTLSASACLTTCPDGKYPDTTSRDCLLCDNSCLTCSASGSSVCLTCKINTFLQTDPGPSSCQSTCPNGKYPDSTTNKCLPCDTPCKTCSTSGSTSCQSCNSPNFLQVPPGPSQCLTTCPAGQYPDTSTQECLPCNTACLTCSLAGISYCLSCKINTYLQSSPGPSSCQTTCPNGKYPDSSNICLFCDSTCKTCIAGDGSSCKSCNSPNFLQIPSGTSSCLTTCPDGYYPDITTRECQICDISCLTCSIAGNLGCLTCKINTYLQSFPGPSSCQTWCPEGKYADISNICLTCELTCKICTTAGASSCNNCNSPYFLQIPPGPSSCLSTCPGGTYPESSTRQCLTCDTSCLTCSAAGASFCLTCKPSTNTSVETAPGPCLFRCSTGYYVDPSTGSTCLSCDSSCEQCISSGATQCSYCPNGSFLQASSCLSNCPSNTYKNATNRTCMPCDITCLTCSGPSSLECLTCEPPKMLSGSQPSQCLSTCITGYYFNDTLNICDTCDSSCASCKVSGENACLTCTTNLFLQNYSLPTACVSDCQTGYYPNNTNFTCLMCDASCLTCSGNGNDNCDSCPNGSYLSVFPGPSYCKSSCSSGFYPDNSTGSCKNCDTSCKDCVTGDMSSCTSCKIGYYIKVEDGLKGNTSGNCVITPPITPVLKNNTVILSYLLVFSSNYSSIYSLYKEKTTISIAGIDNSSYNFNITAVEDTEIFIIDFNVNFSIINSPLMTINLNPPDYIINTYDLQLNNYTIQGNMKYYFYLEPNTLKMINTTTKTTEVLNSVVSNSFIINNFMSFGSTLIFQCMISMDSIRFLRYFEVQYPENVLALFKIAIPLTDIIPNINIDEDPLDGNLPEIFQYYGISVYVFNNNGNMLIEAVNYWVCGILILVLVNIFSHKKSKYIKVACVLMSMVFVWNYALSYFLSNFISFTFYTFLFYRYPTIHTNKGYYNLGFSIITGIIAILVFPFVFFKIRKIRPRVSLKRENSTTNTIFPTYDNEVKMSDYNNDIPKSSSIHDSFSTKANNDDRLIIENLDSPCISPDLKNYQPQKSIIIKPKSSMDKTAPESIKSASIFFKDMKKTDEYPFDLRSVSTATKLNSKATRESTKSFNQLDSVKTNKNQRKPDIDANRYGSFYKDFKHKKSSQSYFLVFSLAKQVLYSFIITITFDSPFFGLLVANIVNVIYIIGLSFVNPLKEKNDVIQNLFNEVCTMGAFGFAFYMAYMDRNGIIDDDLKMRLGWGIVFSNILLIGAFLFRMLCVWAVIFYHLIREIFIRCKQIFKKNNKIYDENGIKKLEKKATIFDNILEMENFLR